MQRFLLAIAALCLALPGLASPVGGDPLLAVRPSTGTPSYFVSIPQTVSAH